MTTAPLTTALPPRAEPTPSGAARRASAAFALLLFSLVSLPTVLLFTNLPSALAVTHPLQESGRTALTPLQSAVAEQAARLSSADAEERRDAVTRLRAMTRPEASRAAVPALGDASPMVRAVAVHAVLSLEPNEAATLVLPLLRERDEFVRRETAYALGRAGGAVAVSPLITALETDRSAAVRGASAVALGQLADTRAVAALANSLAARLPAPGFAERGARRRVEQDEFVRRSAAVALGLIGSRTAVPVLSATLSDERTPDDVRREAAGALGRIGDPAAAPALRLVLDSRDPYLARVAEEALRLIEAAEPRGVR
jgi:HEAT repeat protein